MQALLQEYRNSLNLTKQMREDAPEEDQVLYGGMATNLEYVIKWLKDGQQPATAKARIINFSEPEYIDIFDLTSATDLYAVDPFDEIDNKIDAERRKKHAKRS